MRLWIPAFLLGCSPGVDTDRHLDSDALVDDCDMDDDGERSLACGGLDCDDARSDVAPGATDIVGDGVDQDCDGDPDFGTLGDLPQRQVALGPWRFRPDGLAFGGLVRSLHGVTGSQTFLFDEAAPSAPWRESTWFVVDLGTTVGESVRAWTDEGPLDVFLAEGDGGHALVAWSDGDLRLLRLGEGSPPPTLHALVDGPTLHVVTCGRGELQYRALRLGDGRVTAEASVEELGDRCALLTHGEEPVVLVGSRDPGPIVRYRIRSASFHDRIVLASGKSLAVFDSASTGRVGAWAYAAGNQALILDQDGRGAMLEAPGAIQRLTLSVDQGGGYAAAAETAGGTRLAWGNFRQGEAGAVTRPPGSGSDYVPFIQPGELRFAWLQDGSWTVLQGSTRLDPVPR